MAFSCFPVFFFFFFLLLSLFAGIHALVLDEDDPAACASLQRGAQLSPRCMREPTERCPTLNGYDTHAAGIEQLGTHEWTRADEQ